MDPNLLSNALTPIANAVGQWQTAIFALGYPIFWMLAVHRTGHRRRHDDHQSRFARHD